MKKTYHVSSCCQDQVISCVSLDEGTGHYECRACGKPCNPYVEQGAKEIEAMGKRAEKMAKEFVKNNAFMFKDKPMKKTQTEGWEKTGKKFSDKTGYTIKELIEQSIKDHDAALIEKIERMKSVVFGNSEWTADLRDRLRNQALSDIQAMIKEGI